MLAKCRMIICTETWRYLLYSVVIVVMIWSAVETARRARRAGYSNEPAWFVFGFAVPGIAVLVATILMRRRSRNDKATSNDR